MLYRSSVYSSVSFDKCIHTCSHYPSWDIEYFHLPGKFLCDPFQSVPTSPSHYYLLIFINRLVLPVLELIRVESYNRYSFVSCSYSLNTMILRFVGVSCISCRSLLIAEVVFHCMNKLWFFTFSPFVEFGLFSVFWLLWIKMLCMLLYTIFMENVFICLRFI